LSDNSDSRYDKKIPSPAVKYLDTQLNNKQRYVELSDSSTTSQNEQKTRRKFEKRQDEQYAAQKKSSNSSSFGEKFKNDLKK
jgi:hypothetical protein